MAKSVTGFEVVGAGIIYRRTEGLQGYYPRVVRLGKTEFLCSFVAGRSMETSDSHVELARSLDGGVSWSLQGSLDKNQRSEKYPPTEIGFISLDSDGTLMCLGGRWIVDPDKPDLPLVNPETVGMRD